MPSYAYDAARLAQDFPNLDIRDADGLSGADMVTLSFLLSGTDTSGTRRYLARQVVFAGEELQVPPQSAIPDPPRRRSVRR